MESTDPGAPGVAVLEDPERRKPSLSPSRAVEFKTCPLLFRFRHVDRLPEPLDPLALRGSLVHLVLEGLFRLPPEQRTPARAASMIREAWQLLEPEPGLDEISADTRELLAQEVAGLVENYFRLEDPSSLDIHQLEWKVEHPAEDLLLRGIIDRVELTPEGEWILTDYKTGRSPSDSWAMTSFFGLRFYALICWRTFGKLPVALRLVHLREPEVLTLVPTEQMLEGLERQVRAISKAVGRAYATGQWQPRTGTHCSWCPHKAACPSWAGEDAS